jgi:hypothetical protein
MEIDEEVPQASKEALPGATQLTLILWFSFAAVLDNPITAALLEQ